MLSLQGITSSLILAANLQHILDRLYSKHIQDSRLKDEKDSALSVPYLMSKSGLPLAALFGYHLADRLKDKTLKDIGMQTYSKFRVSEDEMANLVLTAWPDIANYQRVVPVLFKILKENDDNVSLRKLDHFLEICRKDLNPFMAQLKETTSSKNLELFAARLQIAMQKQDLLDTGTVEKTAIEDFFKRQLNRSAPEWPKQLLASKSYTHIDYRLLLSEQYLKCGKSVQDFLRSQMAFKIMRLFKAISRKKPKKKGKKKGGKTSKKVEAKKTSKITSEYMEANRGKKNQDVSQVKFIGKSLVEAMIESVVEECQKRQQVTDKSENIKKSVYVCEPEIAEVELPKQTVPKIGRLKFMGRSGLGVFMADEKGYIMDVLKSQCKSSFDLRPSLLLKKSPIVQYEYYDEKLYFLRENGLLCSWLVREQNFSHQIQTSFHKMTQLSWSFPKYMQIHEGILAINCTHSQFSRIEFYSLSLQYLGLIELKAADYGVSFNLVEEAEKLKESVLGKVAIDKKIKCEQDYQDLIGEIGQLSEQSIGKMLLNFYGQLTISQLQECASWILVFKQRSKVYLPTAIAEKLLHQWSPDSALSTAEKQYLAKLGYLNDEEGDKELLKLKDTLNIQDPRSFNRKTCLMSLFEDNNLDQISKAFCDKKQFLEWLAPACLMTSQLDLVVNELSFRADGKVDMSELYYNEHYLRIVDSRRQRYNPECYKAQSLPPVCIQEFIQLPAYQAIVFSLSFPISSCIFVASMLTGKMLSKIDLSHMSNKCPRLFLSQMNGAVLTSSGRSVSIWQPSTLSVQEPQPKPLFNWISLEESQILDLLLIYENQTLITLTKQCLKVWDLVELFGTKQSRTIFSLKPGYRAVETKSVVGSKQFKKKLYYRGEPHSIYSLMTPNELPVVGVVSEGSTYFVKSFYLHKFYIHIDQSKAHDPVPVKLQRQLSEIAKKRKNLPPQNLNVALNPAERKVEECMMQKFGEKLKAASTVVVKPHKKEELHRQIQVLTGSICGIYQRKMFASSQSYEQEENAKTRYNNIFELLTVSSLSKLKQLLNPQFVELYNSGTRSDGPIPSSLTLQRVLDDSLTLMESKSVHRILYLLSLIEKYSRLPVSTGSISLTRLISCDRKTLDESKIRDLLPSGADLPLDSEVITKCLKVLNGLKQPLKISIEIIKNYLPTRYRFLVPRYIKQIATGKQSPELNEYINNRYELPPPFEQIATKINSKSKGIQQYLQHHDLLKFAYEIANSGAFPEATSCNYSLIEALFCAKAISEGEAFYFCIQESNSPEPRLSANSNPETLIDGTILNDIGEKVLQKLARVKLPQPRTSWDFFKDELYEGPYQADFFYGFLKANRLDRTILTEELEEELEIVRKSLCLRYEIERWKQRLGRDAAYLQEHKNTLMEVFPQETRIVSAQQFKSVLMSLVDSELLYESICRSCAYSCTSSKAKDLQWLEKVAKWDHKNEERRRDIMALPIEGMYVNINHLLRFLQDFNPFELSLPSQGARPSTVSIQIPADRWLQILEGDSGLLHFTKFSQLLSFNLNPITLSEARRVSQSYFKFNKNFCEVEDLLEPKQCIKGEPFIQFESASFLQTVGRALLTRYHRLNLEYRFTIVDNQINTTQLTNLFKSKLIMNLFVRVLAKNSKRTSEFVDSQLALHKIHKEMVAPALLKMKYQMLSQNTPTEIIQLIKSLAAKNALLPVSSIAQHLQRSGSDEAAMLNCLVKHICHEPDAAQTINAIAFINEIEAAIQTDRTQQQFDRYRDAMVAQIQTQPNLVLTFLNLCRPQELPFSPAHRAQDMRVSSDHISQKLLHTQNSLRNYWYINLRENARLLEFINHVQGLQQLKTQSETGYIELDQLDFSFEENRKLLQLFTQFCLCRMGIDELMKIVGVEPSFPEFYQGIKSTFKVFKNYSTHSILKLYKILIQGDRANFGLKIRRVCNPYISSSLKAEWVAAIYEKERLVSPVDHEDVFIDIQIRLQKLKILMLSEEEEHDVEETLKNLKKTLNFQKYLISKYLNSDPSKIKELQAAVQKNDQESVSSLLEMHRVDNALHAEILVGYFKSCIDEKISIIGAKPVGNVNEIQMEELKIIRDYLRSRTTSSNIVLQIKDVEEGDKRQKQKVQPPPRTGRSRSSWNSQKSAKMSEHPVVIEQDKKIQAWIGETKTYSLFRSSSQVGGYYCTMSSLRQFVEEVIIKKCAGQEYRDQYVQKIKAFLFENELSYLDLYELLELSSEQNLARYLPECVRGSTTKENETSILVELVEEDWIYVGRHFATKDYKGAQIKYPLSPADFEALFPQEIKSNNEEEKNSLFREMDIAGMGFVNVNDIPRLRNTQPAYLSPYVEISKYVQQKLDIGKNNSIKPSTFTLNTSSFEPPEDTEICETLRKKLLGFEITPAQDGRSTSGAFKMIPTNVCFAIFGELGLASSHLEQQFLKSAFRVNFCGHLNLSKLINWISQFNDDEAIQMTQSKQDEERTAQIVELSKDIESKGGLHAYFDYTKHTVQSFHSDLNCAQSDSLQKILRQCCSKLSEQAKPEQRKQWMQKALLDKLIELIPPQSSMEQNFILISSLTEDMRWANILNLLKKVVCKYYCSILKWNVSNNSFCRLIKNMPHGQYELVRKFYRAHSQKDMHQNYHQISDHGELTLLSLWDHIERRGITGYSRAEVNQFFTAMDVNGDRSLQYEEFSQFWMACEQVFPHSEVHKNEVMPIDLVGEQLRSKFLQLCLLQLDAIRKQELTLDDISSLANVTNIDKIDRLIRVASKDGPASSEVQGSAGSAAPMKLYKSKLKIMTDNVRNDIIRKADSQKTNLLISSTLPDIYPYLTPSCQISKLIMAKYPRLGFHLLQQLQDLTKLDIQNVKQIYERQSGASPLPARDAPQKKKHSNEEMLRSAIQIISARQPSSPSKNKKKGEDGRTRPEDGRTRPEDGRTRPEDGRIEGENAGLIEKFERLVGNVEQCYRENTLKITGMKAINTGETIAASLFWEQVHEKAEQVSEEFIQMATFVEKISIQSLRNVRPAYLNELISQIGDGKSTPQEISKSLEKSKWLKQIQDLDMKSQTKLTSWEQQQAHKSASNNKPVLDPYRITTSIAKTKTSQHEVVLREIKWLETDYICKSENKVNLLQLSHALSSLTPFTLDQKESSRFVLKAYAPWDSYKYYQPLLSARVAVGLPPADQSPPISHDVVGSMVAIMFNAIELLSEAYQQFGLSGLLLRPSNLLVHKKRQHELIFDDLLSAVMLDLMNKGAASYLEGIDSKIFASSCLNAGCPIPPEALQGIYTEAMDVYLLAHIVYLLHIHMLRPQSPCSAASSDQKVGEEECLWNWQSDLNAFAASKLKESQQSPGSLAQQEQFIWGLLYECSQYDWYQRPKLFQVRQSLTAYQEVWESRQEMKQRKLFESENHEQELLAELCLYNQEDCKKADSPHMGVVLKMISRGGQEKKRWSLQQIVRFRQELEPAFLQNKNSQDLNSVFEYYEEILQGFISVNRSDPDQMRQFMTNVVDYLFMPLCSNQALCFMTSTLYKKILTSDAVKRYLDWCDSNWTIAQFQVPTKLQQLNIENRLNQLHKNSTYYHDLTILAQCRMTLGSPTPAGKVVDTSKKVAISFIHSCLISNNVNKVCALYRSGVLTDLYTYTQEKWGLQPMVLQIYGLATDCLNPKLKMSRLRTIDEVYKVMMIIYNMMDSFDAPKRDSARDLNQSKSTIRPQSRSSRSSTLQRSRVTTAPAPPANTAPPSNTAPPVNTNEQNKSVVSMLEYMNNYYRLGGEECKDTILGYICEHQLCTMASLAYLYSNVDNQSLHRITLNLCYCEKYYRILKSPVIPIYLPNVNSTADPTSPTKSPLKSTSQFKNSRQLRNSALLRNPSELQHKNTYSDDLTEAMSLHQQSITLAEISTASLTRDKLPEVLHQHLKFYAWYNCLLSKYSGLERQLPISYQSNTLRQLQRTLATSQKIVLENEEVKAMQIDDVALAAVCATVKMHRVMLDVWTRPPVHPDFTAATLRFLMGVLEGIYSLKNEEWSYLALYSKNRGVVEVAPDLLYILRRLWESPDLAQMAIRQGYIHFFSRMVKLQHELMQLYIEKNVENIHLIHSYHPEAEFRLISYHAFLTLDLSPDTTTLIHQLLISTGFISYVARHMLTSPLVLDLRFFKANSDVVPFRYCNPLRAEAIALIGLTLSSTAKPIISELCSWLIPRLHEEARMLQSLLAEANLQVSSKMRLVELLWLFSSITQCQDQRLKYEFVNLGLHDRLQSLVQAHPVFSQFFPAMTETLRTGTLLMSSMVNSISI